MYPSRTRRAWRCRWVTGWARRLKRRRRHWQLYRLRPIACWAGSLGFRRRDPRLWPCQSPRLRWVPWARRLLQRRSRTVQPSRRHLPPTHKAKASRLRDMQQSRHSQRLWRRRRHSLALSHRRGHQGAGGGRYRRRPRYWRHLHRRRLLCRCETRICRRSLGRGLRRRRATCSGVAFRRWSAVRSRRAIPRPRRCRLPDLWSLAPGRRRKHRPLHVARRRRWRSDGSARARVDRLEATFTSTARAWAPGLPTIWRGRPAGRNPAAPGSISG